MVLISSVIRAVCAKAFNGEPINNREKRMFRRSNNLKETVKKISPFYILLKA